MQSIDKEASIQTSRQGARTNCLLQASRRHPPPFALASGPSWPKGCVLALTADYREAAGRGGHRRQGPWQSEPRFREAVGARLLGREQASKMWRLNRTGGRSTGPEGCRAQGAQKPRTLHVVVPGLQDTCLCWISCPRTQKVAGKNKEPGTRTYTGREGASVGKLRSLGMGHHGA